MRGRDSAIAVGKPNALGLGDEVADGQHRPAFAPLTIAASARSVPRTEAVKASSGIDGSKRHDGAQGAIHMLRFGF